LATKEAELSHRDQELSSALNQILLLNTELAILRSELGDTRSKHAASQLVLADSQGQIRDMHSQLESTRAEFASTINDKTSRIDELESSILDLRKSREEIAIEGQENVDRLQVELLGLRKAGSDLTKELREAKETHATNEVQWRSKSERMKEEMEERQQQTALRVRKEKDEMRAENEEWSREVKSWKEKEQQATGRAVLAETDNVKLQNDLSTLRQQLEAEQEKWRRERLFLAGELAEQKLLADRLRGEMKTVLAESKGLCDELGVTKARLTSKSSTESETSQRLEASETEVRRLTREDLARTLLIDEQRKAVEQATLEMGTMKSQISNLQQDLEFERTHDRKSQEDMTALRLIVAKKDEDNLRMNAELKTLQGRHQKEREEYETAAREADSTRIEDIANARSEAQQSFQAMTTQMTDSQNNLLLSQSRVASLETELAELRAAARDRPTAPWSGTLASASMSSIQAATGLDDYRIQALTAASSTAATMYAGSAERRKDMEEIDRLELVVEAQKGMIDEQREKIIFWAKVSGTRFRSPNIADLAFRTGVGTSTRRCPATQS
jgi:centromeric protein E